LVGLRGTLPLRISVDPRLSGLAGTWHPLWPPSGPLGWGSSRGTSRLPVALRIATVPTFRPALGRLWVLDERRALGRHAAFAWIEVAAAYRCGRACEKPRRDCSGRGFEWVAVFPACHVASGETPNNRSRGRRFLSAPPALQHAKAASSRLGFVRAYTIRLHPSTPNRQTRSAFHAQWLYAFAGETPAMCTTTLR
jgi:hypothetical protein